MNSTQRFIALLIAGVFLGIGGGYFLSRAVPLPSGISSSSLAGLVGGTPASTGASATDAAPGRTVPTAPASVAAAGTTFETAVNVDGIGNILVQVALPKTPRYADGAPVVVTVPTSFTPENTGYHPVDGITDEGMISVTLMFPGRSDGAGAASAGTDDYGGTDSMLALRDVILFALGKKANADGHALADVSAIPPLPTNVGLYAFSHPGIIATATLATYASDLNGVSFFVGRENPTLDLLSTLELGHWQTASGGASVPVVNPLYSYPSDYAPTRIALDYGSIAYDAAEQAPFFDTNGNDQLDAGEFALGTQVPKMFGKRYYSVALLEALRDNGALTAASWPSDLATPEEGASTWSIRQSVSSYPALSALPDLHVMLVFAVKDHVQTAKDKPHVHQAFDGFRDAGLWVRLNPDASYVTDVDASVGSTYVEHAANQQPSDWASVSAWAFQGTKTGISVVPVAALAEMADRTHEHNWTTDLSSVLK